LSPLFHQSLPVVLGHALSSKSESLVGPTSVLFLVSMGMYMAPVSCVPFEGRVAWVSFEGRPEGW
jgi:hypothetical protein